MEPFARYRHHAEQCIRMAKMADDVKRRALWLGLAQSWMQLGDLAAKKEIEWGSERLEVEDGQVISHWSP